MIVNVTDCDAERGATATEYAVLVGFIAIVIVAGVGFFGTSLNDYYDSIAHSIKAALNIP